MRAHQFLLCLILTLLIIFSCGCWVKKTIDTLPDKNTGYHNIFKIDNFGNYHIAYTNYENELVYASNKTGDWTKIAIYQMMIPNPDAAKIDMAINPVDDMPHIVWWQNNATHQLMHAWIESGYGWQVEVLEIGAGWDPAIAIDSMGTIHIIHYSPTENDTKHLRLAEYIESEVIIHDFGEKMNLEIDQYDRLHLVYNVYLGQVFYACWISGGYWENQLVEELSNNPDLFSNLDLEVDNKGGVHLIYDHGIDDYGIAYPGLKYAYREPGLQTWHIQNLEPGFASFDADLEIDDNNDIHLVANFTNGVGHWIEYFKMGSIRENVFPYESNNHGKYLSLVLKNNSTCISYVQERTVNGEEIYQLNLGNRVGR